MAAVAGQDGRRPPRRSLSPKAPNGVAKSAAKPRGRLSKLRRDIAEIEKRIAAIPPRRAPVEEELCKTPLNRGLQAQYADLTRDAAAMENRWMEVGTELETAETPAVEPD